MARIQNLDHYTQAPGKCSSYKPLQLVSRPGVQPFHLAVSWAKLAVIVSIRIEIDSGKADPLQKGETQGNGATWRGNEQILDSKLFQ